MTHFDDLSKESHMDPKPMPWQFQLHMCDVINESLIQHDIIYFQHTEKYNLFYEEIQFYQPKVKRSF